NTGEICSGDFWPSTFVHKEIVRKGKEISKGLKKGYFGIYMWLDIMNLASQTHQILQIVISNLHFEEKEDFRKFLTVIQHYIDAPPSWTDRSMYKRDITLVVLGLRTMHRLEELRDLSLKDIKWENERTL
ncbi:15505_t:CDS:2, partial [Cetraspora pellucida]